MSYKDIGREEMTRAYSQKGKSGRVIAKELGITYKTFKKKLQEFNIPLKKRQSKYPELNDKEWLRNEYIEKKKSVRQISREIGATTGAIHSAIKWMGIRPRNIKESLEVKYPEGHPRGSLNPRWKGGIRCGKNGKYIGIYSPNHPMVNPGGYVMEHRLVMENKIGRYLTKDEIVHHLNGDGHDNRIENLQLTTRKKHFRDHFDAVKKVEKSETIKEHLESENSRLKKILEDNNIPY